MDRKEHLASELASALWNVSTLRHGMFTPPEFSRLCKEVILRRLNAQHQESRVVENGEVLMEGDWVKENYILDLWMPVNDIPADKELIVGSTPFCYRGQYRRPIQS
jgi:hypothetical protein